MEENQNINKEENTELNVQSSRLTENLSSIEENDKELEIKEKPKKKSCKFPTAYTILIILELVFFILTYIVPKGKYDTIEYSDKNKKTFIIKSYGKDDIEREATQSVLDELGVTVPLKNFEKGLIKNPISIPGTYQRIDKGNLNFFKMFEFPILGLVESCGIAFFLFVLGGTINILIEMKALTSGIEALGRATKGNEFILLILAFIISAFGGTTFGFMEEVLPFYPILMPIFLKSGFDGLLAMSPLFVGSLIGCMFSTVNAFSVVIASYSAGINFVEGIYFRLVSLALGSVVGILYLYFYYLRIKKDKTKSIVYDMRKELEDKYLKKEKNENNPAKSSEEELLIIKEKAEIKEKFTCQQKIGLIILLIGFSVMIFGVLALNWYFEQMTAIFLFLTIIFIVLYRKGEEKGIEVFLQGAGEFIGVSLIIGFARGINITLNEGNISDTLLDSMSSLISGLPKIIFAVLMLIIFIILGFFIQSSSGLAVLSMPVFAPLADEAKVSRSVVINTYMFGQYLISFIAPTGICLIALQLVGIPYNYWIKFIWPFLIILFIFLIALVILNVTLFS